MSDADADATLDRGLQAERTTMAWVRTALAVEATAVLAVRALHATTGALVVLGLTSVCLSAFVLVLLPHLHARRLETMDHATAPLLAPCVLVGVVIVLCLVSSALIALG